jgi:hypothetical protein
LRYLGSSGGRPIKLLGRNLGYADVGGEDAVV